MVKADQAQKDCWQRWMAQGCEGAHPPDWGTYCDAQERWRVDKIAEIRRLEVAQGFPFVRDRDGHIAHGKLKEAVRLFPNAAGRVVKAIEQMATSRAEQTAAVEEAIGRKLRRGATDRLVPNALLLA